jgi:Flp pilus assembly protein TadG
VQARRSGCRRAAARTIQAARGRVRSSRGGSVVELALCLPVLCLLALGLTDIGRGYKYNEAVSSAARQALRVAVSPSQQATANSVCASSAGVATASLPPAVGSPVTAIANDASLESSSDGTPAKSLIAGATLTVTWHCSAGIAITNATNQGLTDPASSGSDAVAVRVSYPMNLLTPLLQQVIGGSAVTIRVDLVGRAEY